MAGARNGKHCDPVQYFDYFEKYVLWNLTNWKEFCWIHVEISNKACYLRFESEQFIKPGSIAVKVDCEEQVLMTGKQE
jgi:hypothetical protein